ncbi:hypothetical protein [Chitinophaga japonensis]|uniref:DUF2306 domain-containing protein n=1 Tax=Chitinophaga japonensis TaxID=104662 RepID=A0A562SZM2_CHIJA|nr:hypothetical protein [Chitinophaga japonensis]TWI86745.1 hypothetical protein LX66_4009 [Chitinophaga japonensis]
MNLPLSTLGIFHTVVSVIALVFAAISLVREGVINPRSRTGRYYMIITVIACVSAFGLSRAGGFNPGHALALLILLLFGVALLAVRTQLFGRASAYVEVFCMSATLFFSLVPGINETFLRLPLRNPLSTDIDSPATQRALMVLFVLFLAGVGWQLLKVRAAVRQRAGGIIH